VTGNPGRPVGYPKTGGAKKGSVHTSSKAVKDAIREVFFDDLGGKKYLRKIAKKDEALFVSLLARLIPAEIRTEINVNHTSLDLGAAMIENQKNLDRLNTTPTPALFTNAQVIEHAPVTANGTDDV
jgi:hypothetical protein